jgi:CheY-like chemotaxis protein
MNTNDSEYGGNIFRCLIVDDNLQAAEIITIFFERNGIISETAENGFEGLKMYLNNPSAYDVIFLDLQMPVMNGFEMAEQIRKCGAVNAGTIPIVAMSGTYTGDITGKGEFNYFLKKPFEMRRLLDIINEIKRSVIANQL